MINAILLLLLILGKIGPYGWRNNGEGEGDECLVSDLARSNWNQTTFADRPTGVDHTRGPWLLDQRLVPTREEMAKILSIAKDRSARDYVFFAIGAHLGFRVSEIAHIKSADVADGRIVITRRKKRVLKPSVVEVPDGFFPFLKEWADSFDGYIFPGTASACIIRRHRKGVALPEERACEGGHISLRTIQRAWALIVAEAGLRKRGRGIHQTRHYFGTQFYNSTRDIRATQEALAHSSLEMTTRYAHVVDMKERVNKVPGLI